MFRRFLHHYWNSGFVSGAAIMLLAFLFVPGDFGLKAAILGGVTALTLPVAAVTFWRAGGVVPPMVSRRATLQRSSAELPPAQEWTREEPLVGILTSGPNRGRHIMAGWWPEDGFWYVVAGRLYAKGEGLTYDELRSILSGEGARYVEPGEYADEVVMKYFVP